jgi:hypothetical protein
LAQLAIPAEPNREVEHTTSSVKLHLIIESPLILGTRLIELTELSVIEHRALEKVNGGRLALTVCRIVNHNATELFESQA